eukprot:CAMPEP_0206142242 /NCGR_PEP_ID=MMETSP1473-20131121/16100_1 /ASSEMBLY_ACC=CAM_ASM_001109 /TAXON_ID=1461547 /ORGANISM="Stichococcus sp, Strain RCC1054" /LENGTH=156 /DNA_ID=CAMNT_0053537161 /DNA_START=278 /DNA_END=749 /DNA_ORIENTATION=+
MSKQRHFTFKYPIGCHRLSCRTGSSETDPGRKQKSVVLTSFWHPGRSSYPDSPRIWSIHGCVHRATGRGLCVQLGTSHAAQILLMDPINPSKNEMLDAALESQLSNRAPIAAAYHLKRSHRSWRRSLAAALAASLAVIEDELVPMWQPQSLVRLVQ